MSKRNPPHPMQPLVRTKDKVIRFKENAIVRFLKDYVKDKGVDMNTLAMMNFSVEDREQFLQLIGYSVSGFGDLSYVRKKVRDTADAEAEKLL